MTSAAGLVVADIVHNFVQTAVSEFSQVTPEFLSGGFYALLQRATATLHRDGVPPAQRRYDRSLDMKYVGQGYTLNIPVTEAVFTPEALSALAERFHTRHETAYGFRADAEPVEIINLRLQATGELPKPQPRPQSRSPRSPETARCGTRLAWVERQQDRQLYQIYDRDRLRAGQVLPGPAIVEQVDSTTVIPPAWLGTVDGYGNLILGTEEWPAHA
jgi:N-methylhydantoinase A